MRTADSWSRRSATPSEWRVAAVGVPGDVTLYGDRAYVAAEGPSALSGNVTAYEATTGRRLGGVELLACSLTAGPGGVWVAGCPNVQQLSDGDPMKILR